MKKINEKFNIWEEKYRPQVIEDLILPEEYKKQFKEIVKQEMLPNMLFVSSIPGTGKTSLVKCIINETDPSVKWINASQNNNVSTVRNEIVGFASTISAEGKKKLIVLDEADNLSTSSAGTAGAQDILRGVIEQYSQNVRFILTANYKDRFITPLLSRLKVYDFDEIFMTHKKELAKQMYQRLIFICENEKIEYKKEDLQELIKTHYPSMRNMIVALQQNIFDNKLILKNKKVDTIYDELFQATLQKDFEKVRQLTLEASNPSGFYTWFFKHKFPLINDNFKIELAIKLAYYQELDRNARNKAITLTGFLSEIMQKV
jgi:replication factor C small subunit